MGVLSWHEPRTVSTGDDLVACDWTYALRDLVQDLRNRPYAKLRRAGSNQDCAAGSWTVLEFSVATKDNTGPGGYKTTRLTAQRAGLYHVWGCAGVSDASGGTWLLAVRQNGFHLAAAQTAAVNVYSANVSGIVALALGDYLELCVYNMAGTDTTALDYYASSPVLGFTYLGDPPAATSVALPFTDFI